MSADAVGRRYGRKISIREKYKTDLKKIVWTDALRPAFMTRPMPKNCGISVLFFAIKSLFNAPSRLG